MDFLLLIILTCIGLILSFILVYVIAIIGFSFMNLEFKTTKPILEMEAMIFFLSRENTKSRLGCHCTRIAPWTSIFLFRTIT